MSSQHANPALTVRPDPTIRAAGQAVLTERNLGLQAFIAAALAALAENPDRLLEVLTPHWPEQRKRGRPSKLKT